MSEATLTPAAKVFGDYFRWLVDPAAATVVLLQPATGVWWETDEAYLHMMSEQEAQAIFDAVRLLIDTETASGRVRITSGVANGVEYCTADWAVAF